MDGLDTDTESSKFGTWNKYTRRFLFAKTKLERAWNRRIIILQLVKMGRITNLKRRKG